MKKRFSLALGAVFLLTGLASGQRGLPAINFSVGEPFPTLSFPALDGGKPVSLADFRGQKVILHIFASW